MPTSEPPRARPAYSALRIQFFELSRVGRAFAYGDSIDVAAFWTGKFAVNQRAGVGATQPRPASAPVGRCSQSIASQVSSSFFDLSDGESTVTSSEAVSTFVIRSVGLLRIKADQDVSNSAGSKAGDHTAAVGWGGAGRRVFAITIKPLPHKGQTFAAPWASAVSFATEIDWGVASSFSSKRHSASFSWRTRLARKP